MINTRQSTNASEYDLHFMSMCLELAKRAEGRTAPNPAVGATVVDADGQVVSQGYHAKAGEPHAEVIALNQAANLARGQTLYVSLEPCCHFGKTPPCIDRIIESGISRVVVGMQDPNPLVSGKGIEALRAAGIEVVVPVLEAECYWLNRGFVKVMTQRLPWLALKMATTLDGKIADREGISRYISGQEARLYVQQLRNVFDCVMIGGATAIKDNPELTVREIANGRNPLRAIVDTSLKIPPSLSVCSYTSQAASKLYDKTVIFATQQAVEHSEAKFGEHVHLVGIDKVSNVSSAISCKQEKFTQLSLTAVLNWLASYGVLTVMCEGGGRLAGALLSLGLVDEIYWILAPKILIDKEAIPSAAGLTAVALPDAVKLKNISYQQLGQDMLIHGLVVGDESMIPPGYQDSKEILPLVPEERQDWVGQSCAQFFEKALKAEVSANSDELR